MVQPAVEPDYFATDKPTARRVLVDALAARYGGAAYAAVQLSRRLVHSPEVSTVAVVARRGSIVDRGLADEQDVRRITLPSTVRLELVHRVAWEARQLPALVSRDGFDALVSMSGMLPRSPGCKSVSLLFNPVILERDDASNRLRRWAVERTSSYAQPVAPSRAMAKMVSAAVGRECAVVPLGIDHDVFAPGTRAGREILCVADFYAHKRHDVLVDAWTLLAEPRPRLRLIGNPEVDVDAHRALRARIASLPQKDSVVIEHDLALARLVAAYQEARLFVMPSERESFCMPLAEGMACGAPAVARDIASLRETGGVGARYVSGDDPAAWAAAMQELLTDETAYDAVRTAAIQSAARFSWDAFAKGVLAVLN